MLRELLTQWSDPYGSMSHGPLVLALAIFFGWRAWTSRTSSENLRSQGFWLLPLAGLVALAIVSELLFLGSSRMALLPPIVFTAIAAIMGWTIARRFIPAVLFLFLGLPVWQLLNSPLQGLTTRVSTWLVRWSGIPVYVEGNFVHLSDGVFEIASGCAGLNYFLAALTLGATFALWRVPQRGHQLRVLLAFAIAGMVSNWLRVTLLILIGHHTQMQHYLIRVDHLGFGWVLFLAMMVPAVLWARRYMGEPSVPPVLKRASVAAPRVQGLVGLAATAMLVAPFFAGGGGSSEQQAVTAEVRMESGWRPVFVGAEVTQESVDGVDRVVARYAQPRRDARISLVENDVGGAGWQLSSREVLAEGLSKPVLESRGKLEDRERLIWSWYEVAGRRVLSKPGYRWAELLGALSGRRDALIVAYATDCLGDCEVARARLAAQSVKPIAESLL